MNAGRPLVLRRYALCEQLLREELGVAPTGETRREQETILSVLQQVSLAQLEKTAAKIRTALNRQFGFTAFLYTRAEASRGS